MPILRSVQLYQVPQHVRYQDYIDQETSKPLSVDEYTKALMTAAEASLGFYTNLKHKSKSRYYVTWRGLWKTHIVPLDLIMLPYAMYSAITKSRGHKPVSLQVSERLKNAIMRV